MIEEDAEFEEEFLSDRDPSILHFLLAAGDDLNSKQLRDDLMTMLIAGHETTAAVLTWTFHLLSQHPKIAKEVQNEVSLLLLLVAWLLAAEVVFFYCLVALNTFSVLLE